MEEKQKHLYFGFNLLFGIFGVKYAVLLWKIVPTLDCIENPLGRHKQLIFFRL